MAEAITGFMVGIAAASACFWPIIRFVRRHAYDKGWFDAGKLAIKLRDRERAAAIARAEEQS